MSEKRDVTALLLDEERSARVTAALAKRGKELTRESMERIADIIGPHSAAGETLREADEYDGEVRFWKLDDYFILERL